MKRLFSTLILVLTVGIGMAFAAEKAPPDQQQYEVTLSCDHHVNMVTPQILFEQTYISFITRGEKATTYKSPVNSNSAWRSDQVSDPTKDVTGYITNLLTDVPEGISLFKYGGNEYLVVKITKSLTLRGNEQPAVAIIEHRQH